MTITAVLAGLGSLAQETRLAIYRLLVETGPGGLSASAIAKALEVPASSLSFHLHQLAHAGLITHERAEPTAHLLRQLRPHERARGVPHGKRPRGHGLRIRR